MNYATARRLDSLTTSLTWLSVNPKAGKEVFEGEKLPGCLGNITCVRYSGATLSDAAARFIEDKHGGDSPGTPLKVNLELSNSHILNLFGVHLRF